MRRLSHQRSPTEVGRQAYRVSAANERSAHMEQANETHGGDSRPVRNIARGGQTSGDASARQVITDLSSSVWAFSALACALEAGLLEALSKARRLTDLASGPVSLPAWSRDCSMSSS